MLASCPLYPKQYTPENFTVLNIETNSLNLKMDGWKTIVSFVEGLLSFLEKPEV